MKRRKITPLPYFTRDKHVGLDESDVDSNLENQVRNTRQMVGHGLCTTYLGSANTNYIYRSVYHRACTPGLKYVQQ